MLMKTSNSCLLPLCRRALFPWSFAHSLTELNLRSEPNYISSSSSSLALTKATSLALVGQSFALSLPSHMKHLKGFFSWLAPLLDLLSLEVILDVFPMSDRWNFFEPAHFWHCSSPWSHGYSKLTYSSLNNQLGIQPFLETYLGPRLPDVPTRALPRASYHP